MWNSDASDGETYEESVKSSVLKSLEDMILLKSIWKIMMCQLQMKIKQ